MSCTKFSSSICACAGAERSRVGEKYLYRVAGQCRHAILDNRGAFTRQCMFGLQGYHVHDDVIADALAAVEIPVALLRS